MLRLVLDERGVVWTTTFPNTNQEALTELFFMHNGAVNAIALSVDHPLMATGGADGNIRVYDNHEKSCVAVWNSTSSEENLQVTAITWLPENASHTSRYLVVGHNEGTLRLLDLPGQPNDTEEKSLASVHKVPRLNEHPTIRMQIGEVVQIACNRHTGIVVSMSDLMMLISEIQLPNIVPLSLYGIKSPLYLSWKRDWTRALITNGLASVYEVALPVEKAEATLLDPAKIDEPEEQKKLTPLSSLPSCRVFELKSIKAKLQGFTDSDVPSYAMSRVVWAVYDTNNADMFWMSTLDADSGYLYLCSFGQSGPTEPLRGAKLDPHYDLTVKYLEFLDHGHLAIVGTADGHLVILLLKEHFKYVVEVSDFYVLT